jgi:hypothetical protein
LFWRKGKPVCRCRCTRIVRDGKGKERIKIELAAGGRVLGEKDETAIKAAFVDGVKNAAKEKRALVGSYRGFEVYALRHLSLSDADGFRFALKGNGEQEFQPDNLIYSNDDKVSISGWFQRLDNFLDKGLEREFQTYKGNVEREIAELATVQAALGQEFQQKDELTLTRDNHAAVMRELKRMQDEPGYVSAWEPKTSLVDAGVDQGGQPQKTALLTGDHGQDTARSAAQALKNEARQRFGVEALNRVVFASVPSSGADQTRGEETQFAEAGFSAHYAGGVSPRVYKKAPQKTADGGEVAIRIEPTGNGAFTVFSQYEKNHIIDARRSHSAAADSADEALVAVANFEKYLFPDTARAAEQAAPMPSLRMR